jgi:hypothetical protein
MERTENQQSERNVFIIALHTALRAAARPAAEQMR